MKERTQFTSTYYRRHNTKPPTEHPYHPFSAWRKHMVDTKEVIGYTDWLARRLAG